MGLLGKNFSTHLDILEGPRDCDNHTDTRIYIPLANRSDDIQQRNRLAIAPRRSYRPSLSPLAPTTQTSRHEIEQARFVNAI